MDVFCVMQLQAREKARAPTHKRDSERKSATARQRECVYVGVREGDGVCDFVRRL